MFGKKNKLPESIEIYELVHVLKSLDELLENLPPDLIKGFSASRDFKLYEKILKELDIIKEKPIVIEEEKPKAIEHPTFMQEVRSKNISTNSQDSNSVDTKNNQEAIINNKSPSFDFSKIEELFDKKLKEFEETQNKKEKDLILSLKKSIGDDINNRFDELSKNIVIKEDTKKVQNSKDEESVKEEKEEVTKKEEPVAKRESGLLDLDKLRAKIDARVKEENSKPKTETKEEKKEEKETPKATESVEPKIEDSPKKSSDENTPDMAAIKAEIIKKLRGVSK